MALGTQLGYRDEQLQQQTLEKEGRHQNTEAEREVREAERAAREPKAQCEREARDAERAGQYERECEERELQERLVRMWGEQELEKLRLEAQLKAETGGMRHGFCVRDFNASRPKLPAFNKQVDDMDVYLERYERFATSKEWDELGWLAS